MDSESLQKYKDFHSENTFSTLSLFHVIICIIKALRSHRRIFLKSSHVELIGTRPAKGSTEPQQLTQKDDGTVSTVDSMLRLTDFSWDQLVLSWELGTKLY